ncbi:hypothetical protein I4U30_21710 [Enterobacter asburiae]|uniref:hypothetical protein n=1 Tax=Enterobacter asburiae TaxID=61645 RepID=UPI00192C3BE3|nr:hypothetical protein [Enterobacter asburiae]MBL5840886.1 hypothetical protein [Enterobacter asburiae]
MKKIIVPLALIVSCALFLNFVFDKTVERNYKLRKDTCDNVRLMFQSAVFNDVCYVELKPGVYVIHGMPNGRDPEKFYTKEEVFNNG